MKKIVYVIGHMGNGGAERVISILANASIAEENIIITLFSNKQDYHLNSNVRVIYIDVTSIKNRDPVHLCKTSFVVVEGIQRNFPRYYRIFSGNY